MALTLTAQWKVPAESIHPDAAPAIGTQVINDDSSAHDWLLFTEKLGLPAPGIARPGGSSSYHRSSEGPLPVMLHRLASLPKWAFLGAALGMRMLPEDKGRQHAGECRLGDGA